MINFDKIKHINYDDSFYFVTDSHIEKYNLNVRELIEKCNFFNELANKFHVTFDKLYSLTIYLQIPIRDLFSFSIYESNSLCLIASNVLYEDKRVKEGYFDRIKKVYYNVYLTQNEYITLKFSDFAFLILKEQFPKIFDNPLFKHTEKRFDKEIPNFGLKTKLKISDISHEYGNLTINDIVNIVKNYEYVNENIEVSNFAFYYHGNDVFYLHLGDCNVQGHTYRISMAIPYKALYDKDFNLVEKHEVFGVIKPNANKKLGKDSNNWYNGEQKNNPHWEIYYKDYIQELKKLISE